MAVGLQLPPLGQDLSSQYNGLSGYGGNSVSSGISAPTSQPFTAGSLDYSFSNPNAAPMLGNNAGMDMTNMGGGGQGFQMPGLGSLAGWGDMFTAGAGIFNAWAGHQQNKEANKQFDITQNNWQEQFDYSKGLTEERRGRHNALRSAYS